MGEHINRIIESRMLPYISELLANERSMFDTELPTDITGGIQFRMFVMFINPVELPGHCIEEKVLPALYSGKNDSYSWQIIPAKYFSK